MPAGATDASGRVPAVWSVMVVLRERGSWSASIRARAALPSPETGGNGAVASEQVHVPRRGERGAAPVDRELARRGSRRGSSRCSRRRTGWPRCRRTSSRGPARRARRARAGSGSGRIVPAGSEPRARAARAVDGPKYVAIPDLPAMAGITSQQPRVGLVRRQALDQVRDAACRAGSSRGTARRCGGPRSRSRPRGAASAPGRCVAELVEQLGAGHQREPADRRLLAPGRRAASRERGDRGCAGRRRGRRAGPRPGRPRRRRRARSSSPCSGPSSAAVAGQAREERAFEQQRDGEVGGQRRRLERDLERRLGRRHRAAGELSRERRACAPRTGGQVGGVHGIWLSTSEDAAGAADGGHVAELGELAGQRSPGRRSSWSARLGSAVSASTCVGDLEARALPAAHVLGQGQVGERDAVSARQVVRAAEPHRGGEVLLRPASRSPIQFWVIGELAQQDRQTASAVGAQLGRRAPRCGVSNRRRHRLEARAATASAARRRPGARVGRCRRQRVGEDPVEPLRRAAAMSSVNQRSSATANQDAGVDLDRRGVLRWRRRGPRRRDRAAAGWMPSSASSCAAPA